LLALGRPERPPVESIAAEPQRRRPQRRQLLVEVGIVRIEPGIGEVGGFEGHSDVVCSETGAVLLRTNRDRGPSPETAPANDWTNSVGVGLGSAVWSAEGEEPSESDQEHPAKRRASATTPP